MASLSLLAFTTPEASAAACRGDIYQEYGTSGRTYASWWDTSWSADGDPSDQEYVFRFYPAWAGPMSSMRVASSGWDISMVISSRWGNHMLSPQACASPVTLVADKLAVDITGGPGYWRNNLWLWHR